MAIKGFERTRTKAQNSREIIQSQGGFLGGLNTDLPKSDVGDTQLPVLKNCLPFRDRVEARGGIKPQTNYPLRSGDNGVLFDNSVRAVYYDQDWDAIFYIDTSSVVNVSTPYTKDITPVYGGGAD
ncbi:MAG: hypothetical protein GY861_00340, partial [bacterium]|nr:hypothetical protein [bacterium]